MTKERLLNSAGILRPWGRALWERVLRLGRHAPKRLRLCESLPLGERRFVAVIEFDASRFLVGGTASSLVLLSRLGDGSDGAEEGEQENVPRKWAITARNRPVEKC